MKQLLPRLALSLFAAVAIAAQTAPGADQGKGGKGHWGGHHGHQGSPFVHVLEKAKGELKLTADQQAKWADAEAAGKAAREAMRQDHEKMHSLMETERQKDIMDLGKLDQQTEQMMDAGRKAREQAKDKWLAVYDSLSDDQKRIVSKHIKDAMAHMDTMRERMKARIKNHMQGKQQAPAGTPPAVAQ